MLLTTIIWPVTQCRCITELTWHKTKIKMIAAVAVVNVSRWTRTQTLHHPVITGPTIVPRSS